MTTLITLFLALLNLAVGSLLVVLYQRVKALQDNHIATIEKKIDMIYIGVEGVTDKLDQHILYHLEHKL